MKDLRRPVLKEAGASRTTRLAQDTGFTPAFDIAAAVADYVMWGSHKSR